MSDQASPSAKKKLTPKQQVLKARPAAYSYRWRGATCIYLPLMGGNINMGVGSTPAKAWADALANMQGEKL